MLPPLFLDVEPHHKVLDMCAAPGSKVRVLSPSPQCPLAFHFLIVVRYMNTHVSPDRSTARSFACD